MQNAGLPEAGDAVFTFPHEVLVDREAYDEAARLDPDAPEKELAGQARVRRDLAMRGYLELVVSVEENGQEALREFHRIAARVVRPRVEAWRRIWCEGVERELELTRGQLAALERGEPGIMHDAALVRTDPHPGPKRFGMCGRLRTWQARDIGLDRS